MRFWGKRNRIAEGKGVAVAALGGVRHQELIEAALNELVTTCGADRVGVWLEDDGKDGTTNFKEPVFHGLVWDRETEAPKEWRTLAPHSVLPASQFLSGASFQLNFKQNDSGLLVGPIAGLRSAIWAPVQHAGRIRGVLLAGTFLSHGEMAKLRLEAMAAGLAVALNLETEKKLAGERYAD